MARDLSSRSKHSRREGESLGLFGYRDETTRCKFGIPIGMHGGKKKPKAASNYAYMLRVKQKLKRMYGLLEKQFRRFFAIAAKMKGSTGNNLLQLLECRLDNVVYRMGFASTRAEARQVVNHRSITVNGQIVNIPSYLVKAGDVIEVREKSKQQVRIQAAVEAAQQREIPEWVKVDFAKLTGEFTYIPKAAEIPVQIDLNKIVEFYSR